MSAADERRRVVERYLRAMQAGAAGQEEIVALFTDDGVYIEPFSAGEPRMHTGKAAIRAALARGRAQAPANLTLELLRVDVEGDRMHAEWQCSAPVFAVPVRGCDHYLIREGKIARLEVTVSGPISG